MALGNLTNNAVNATRVAVENTQTILIPTLWQRFLELVIAPWQIPSMLWILGPLVLMLVLMEFYFGRYSNEELGWNTAVGNSMVLFFVALDLLRTIYNNHNPITLYQVIFHDIQAGALLNAQYASTIMALCVLALGVVMLFVDFFHILPKKFAFSVSSSLPINLTAYMAIVLVYGNINQPGRFPYDWYTLAAAIVLFIALWIFFGILKFLEPKARDYFGKAS
ncbi:MAG: hypothetical protein ABIA93_05755 [Candidatus Woesearchaeota archaeon]